jgi:hypothetical protein
MMLLNISDAEMYEKMEHRRNLELYRYKLAEDAERRE